MQSKDTTWSTRDTGHGESYTITNERNYTQPLMIGAITKKN